MIRKKDLLRNMYIHIPFCMKKCSFCDFSVYATGTGNEREDLQEKYIDHLQREIDLTLTIPGVRERIGLLETLYVGGGTPSVLTAKNIRRLGQVVSSVGGLSKGAEVTFEIMPGTLDKSKLEAMVGIGVNRISMGVQSLNEKELEMLGRVHSKKSIFETLDIIVQNERFGNLEKVNLDMLLGTPNQTPRSLKSSLEELIGLGSSHISSYILELPENSPFGKKYREFVHPMPPERAVSAIFESNATILRSSGFTQYQISNFARSPTLESRHNKMYWEGDVDYLAFGSGAASLLDGFRLNRPKSIKKYMDLVDQMGNLPREEVGKFLEGRSLNERSSLYLHLESVLLGGLTTTRGVSIPKIRGIVENWSGFEGIADQFVYEVLRRVGGSGKDGSEGEGLVEVREERIRCKDYKSMLLCDEVMVDMLMKIESVISKMGLLK